MKHLITTLGVIVAILCSFISHANNRVGNSEFSTSWGEAIENWLIILAVVTIVYILKRHRKIK